MVGQAALGLAPIGGVYHELPTVTVSAPTSEQVLTTGGPSVTVSWSFSQLQSDPQAWYRVVFTNDAGSTEYHDTGWVEADDGSVVVNLSDTAVPLDSADVSATVYVATEPSPSDGLYYQKASSLRPFQLQWGVVTCTIDDPVSHEVISTTLVTADWSFASTRSKTQQAYRVRLLSQDGAVVYHDTGWVVSTDTSYEVPFLLSDGAQYLLGVQLRNSEGVQS